jgi:hypothetical protein
MPIFAVMGLEDARLGPKVKEQFPDYFALGLDKWFVAANGATAASIARQLGMGPEDGSINGVVVTVGGYFGLARSDLWEWLKAKGSQVPVG